MIDSRSTSGTKLHQLHCKDVQKFRECYVKQININHSRVTMLFVSLLVARDHHGRRTTLRDNFFFFRPNYRERPESDNSFSRCGPRRGRGEVRSVRDQLPATSASGPNLGMPGSRSSSAPTGADGCRSHRDIRRDVNGFFFFRMPGKGRRDASRGRDVPSPRRKISQNPETRAATALAHARRTYRGPKEAALLGLVKHLHTTAARLTSRERA